MLPFSGIVEIFVALDMLLFLCIFSIPVVVFAGDISKGHSLVNVVADTAEKIAYLEQWRQGGGDELDFWSERFQKPDLYTADILVPPGAKNAFIASLKHQEIPVKIIHDDILSALEEEERERLFSTEEENIHNSFLTFENIQAYLSRLATERADIVQLEHTGRTQERRNMTIVKVGKCSDCPSIFIEGGIHAREWLSPAVALNIIDKLVKDPSADIINKITWYILPVTNPDGYAYSHEKPSNRLWRKNRALIKLGTESEPIGVDLNRNFDYDWKADQSSSGISWPYSDTYKGPSVASELETQAIQSFVTKRQKEIKVYIALHTFSQLVLYSCPKINGTNDCKRLDKETIEVAEKIVRAIAASGGEKYEAGPADVMLYPVSGTSQQWAQFTMKIPLAYTIEMRPAQSSDIMGFIVPATEIEPTSHEIWAAMQVIAGAVLAPRGDGAQ